MNDLILFLKETDHIDKMYVFFILIFIFIILAVAIVWMTKKGIGFKIAGIQLTPNKIKELEEEEKITEKFTNLTVEKSDKETIKNSKDMEKDLTDLIDLALKSNPELKLTIKTKVEELETKLENLEMNVEKKKKEIEKLEKTIVKYTLDKTVDYISFDSCLEEIMTEFAEIMKGVCYTFSNDLNFCHISEQEYDKLIRNNTIQFLKQSREILKSKFSGKIIDEIQNLYVFIDDKEEKKFESNYRNLYYTLRTISSESENIKSRVLERTGQQITSAFVNWKKTIIPKFEEIEKSAGRLDTIKKVNYLLQKDDILNLVATISSIYNTYKDQDKTNIFKKQMEVVEIFQKDFEYLIKINFEKFLIKTVNENKIDVTQCYK